MKFYENLAPLERKKLVLNAAAFDAAMEGMDEVAEECREELRALDKGDVSATFSEPAAQKN